MSPKIRFASAVLVVAALACGSLGALPLGPDRVVPERGWEGILTAVEQWIVSLFRPELPTPARHKPAQTKAGSTMDPNGGPG
jgi:hypothetical protein